MAEMEAALEVHVGVEDPVQAVNGNPPRTGLLQVGFLAIGVSGALISDLSINPLTGLYIFLIYAILFIGLLLLLTAAFPSSISTNTAKRMMFIATLVIYVGLALKMRLPLSSYKSSR